MTTTTIETTPRSTLGVIKAIVSVILWLATVGGAIIGALEAGVGLFLATSAPQEAAAAGIGCVWAIVPYVLARAFDEATRGTSR